MTGSRRVLRDEVRRRLRFVEDLLATATPHEEICRQFVRSFNATHRTAERYIARVRKEFALDAQPTLTKLAAVEAAAWHVHHLARNDGRYAASVSALRLVAELNGLLKLRAEISGPDGKAMDFTVNAEQWKALQREIYGSERQGSVGTDTTTDTTTEP